jgi:hypothetical protein
MSTEETSESNNKKSEEGSQEQPLPVPAPMRPSKEYSGAAAFFLVVAFVVGIYGVWISYSDAKVVGGDAYNYIIGAARGVAVVGLAIIFGLIGVVYAIAQLGVLITFYNQPRK